MKHTKFVFTFLLYTILSINLFAQVTQEWIQRYNGPGNSKDRVRSIKVDGQGFVYVTGYSWGSGTDDDFATVKYNSSGVQQWVARYNGTGNGPDGASALAVDDSGNVYVTGYSWGSETDCDYATIKYNSSGVQQWVARYNGTGNGEDAAKSIALDCHGNVYVTGYSLGSGTDDDYATIKYNSSGVQQWVARYNGPGNSWDGTRSIAVDDLGNVYITGHSVGIGTGSDYATIKYNTSGVQQWVARYNGPNGPGGANHDFPYTIAVDGQENIYVTGYSWGTYNDYATIMYDSSGVQQWISRYNGPGSWEDHAYSLVIDGYYNVLVTGRSTGSGNTFDYATIKYDERGVQQWVATYDGPEDDDYAYSIDVDNSGNVYVTGRSYETWWYTAYATIKYNSNGVQQWVVRYGGIDNSDAAFSIAVDDLGNVYVTGESIGIGTGFDYTTIKYTQQTGLQIISTEIPKFYSLYQNYPNPFNPSTNIKFDLKKSLHTKLIIYNILGKEVATLVNEKLNAGSYEVSWFAPTENASDLSSGLYFYQLVAGDYVDTKKMILIK